MPYFTFPVSVRYPQLSIDDLLSMDLSKEYQLLPVGKPGDIPVYLWRALNNVVDTWDVSCVSIDAEGYQYIIVFDLCQTHIIMDAQTEMGLRLRASRSTSWIWRVNSSLISAAIFRSGLSGRTAVI